MLRLIGGFKLVKALLLLAFAAAMVEPHHWITHTVAKLRDLDWHTREKYAIALVAYASLYVVEGIGLILRKVWAEYLTTVITISFIPLEVYEMIEHRSALKALVIAANVAAVGYLLWRLRRDKHWPWRPAS